MTHNMINNTTENYDTDDDELPTFTIPSTPPIHADYSLTDYSDSDDDYLDDESEEYLLNDNDEYKQEGEYKQNDENKDNVEYKDNIESKDENKKSVKMEPECNAGDYKNESRMEGENEDTKKKMDWENDKIEEREWDEMKREERRKALMDWEEEREKSNENRNETK